MLLRKPKFTLQAKVGGLGEKRKVEPADYGTRLSIRAGQYAVERFCETIKFQFCVNDPSAGSPTETLLRLLLPRNVQI